MLVCFLVVLFDLFWGLLFSVFSLLLFFLFLCFVFFVRFVSVLFCSIPGRCAVAQGSIWGRLGCDLGSSLGRYGFDQGSFWVGFNDLGFMLVDADSIWVELGVELYR